MTTITRRPTREADPLERVVSRGPAEKAHIFGYPAGKASIASKIVPLLCKHTTYVEPFCGSAAVFFSKEAAPNEALNDRDKEVVGALKAIQKLSKSDIEKLRTMPWVGSEKHFHKVRGSTPAEGIDALYKFLYTMRFSFGNNRKSWGKSEKSDGVTTKVMLRVERHQERLKNAKITSGDYEKAIKANDGRETLFFIDPPYVGYDVNVGEKDFDETRFRKVLEGIKGRFLVTCGTKGNLDTSGFEVRRLRQARRIGANPNSNQSKYLNQLIVSNYKLQAKSLGDGFELDEVMEIIDVEPNVDRFQVTGSRSSVSVPSDVTSSRAWKHDDLLRTYPEEPGPIPACVQVRFLEKKLEMDVSFDVAGQPVAWTMAVQRAEVMGNPLAVAKSFSVEGSRFFLPLSKGVPAREMVESLATDLVKIDRPVVELGLQTDTVHEYFLSKGDELAGALVLERDTSLGEKHPWIATFVDRWPSFVYAPQALKSSSPMPPDGVSALPQALEASVPQDFKYWELRGDEAKKARDALIASGLLGPGSVAIVDGDFARVTTKWVMAEEEATPSSDWVVGKVKKLLPDDMHLVEVFTPGRTELEKADGIGRCVYIDAGGESDGALEILAKSLESHAGHYVVTALDSVAARASLEKMGRVFKFIPGPIDAIDRIFVSSFGVREDVAWLEKDDWYAPGVEGVSGDRLKAEWSTAYVNDLPDSAFLFVEAGEKDDGGKTKPRSLRHFPVRDKDGKVDVAHARNAIARIPQSNASGLSADKKSALQDKARRLLEEAQKQIESGPNPPRFGEEDDKPKATVTTPSDDSPDLGKADFNNPDAGGPGPAAPGFLQPAQGNPYEKKPRYGSSKALAARLFKADGDDQIVFGIVLEPDTVDAQNDVYSVDEVRAAAHRYMEEFQNTGLMHQKKINEKAKVVESYLAPSAFVMGNEQVKKGTWCMSMHVLDKALWEDCKKGAYTGFSIGGSAQRTPEHKALKEVQHRGIKIKIDRPKGFVQTGTDADGNAWSREYKTDYGFIPRTKGGDGEGLDVFIGPNPDSPMAYWISQTKPDGSFDEFKAMVGYGSAEEAKSAYLDHVPEKYFGSMSEVSIEHMKALLNIEPEVEMQPVDPP